jgi:hypothetical protein
MFTAKTTFTPETPTTSSSAGGLSALAGVASQLGFNISSSGSVSPDFFVKLAGSGEVLRSTLPTEFDEPGSRERKHPLLNILEIKGRTPEERLQRGGILLRKRIKASADKPTTQPNGNRQGVKRRVLLADDVPKPQSGAVIFVPTRTMQEQPSNVAGLITTVAQGLTARVTIYVVARK